MNRPSRRKPLPQESDATPGPFRRISRTVTTAFVVMASIAGVRASATEPRSNELRFSQIGLEQGLSQASVQVIHQDHYGFMWFGTQEGLNRYDGYEFKVFSVQPDTPGSISHDWIWSILEDRHHQIWIGTDGGGLNLYDPSTESFRHFKSDARDPGSLSHNRVRVLYEDQSGNIWVGTDGGGLNRFAPESGTFTQIRPEGPEGSELSDARILSVLEDGDGWLWIGTDGAGLYRLNPKTDEVRNYRHDPDSESGIASNQIRCLFQDNAGNLWIGTSDEGLDRYDPQTERFEHFRHEASDPASLSHDRIRGIFEDSTDALWVATDGGVSVRPPGREDFVRYRHDPFDQNSLGDNRVLSVHEDNGGVIWIGTYGGLSKTNLRSGTFGLQRHNPNAPSLSGNVVTSFAEDPLGRIWIGTYGNGLNRFDPRTGEYLHYEYDAGKPTGLSDSRIMFVMADSSGTVWIGTRSSGLDRLDPSSGAVTHFRHDPADPTSLSADGVTSLLEDRDGALWVGTYGGGLNRFDRTTRRFERFQRNVHDPHSLSSDRVISLFEDQIGILWIGTEGGGVNRLDRDSLRFDHYENDPEDPNSLSSNVAWSFYEDDRRVLWVGTQDGGLNRWEPSDRDARRGRFTRFTKADGLLSNMVYGILEDDRGNLWLSTNRGLSKFDPSRDSFRHYDTSYGLQSNEFNFGAYLRAGDGFMYFGGPSGFNTFDPRTIRDNSHSPRVVLTSFAKLNQRVQLGAPTPEIDRIDLTHRDHMVTFEFAALDFTAPEKNQYRYKLDGFDEEWVELGNDRRATYTNLAAGSYVLRVEGSNNDGLWSKPGLEVDVVVHPAPWRSWWAYLAYASIFGGVFLGYDRRHRRRVEAEARSKEAAEAASRAKSDFLAMVSHELRTPMNGVLGSTELLLNSDMSAEQRKLAESAYRSGRGLLGIIDDILEFSSAGAGSLNIVAEEFSPEHVVRSVHDAVAEEALAKGLSLTFDIEESMPASVEGDPVRLKQVLMNLVRNAVKYTHAGRIDVVAAADASEGDRVTLRFTVTDTGIGIAKKEQERIFEAFSQAGGFATRKFGGTGLGLGMASQLCAKMGGEIGVDSAPGRGSTFWFTASVKLVESGAPTVPDSALHRERLVAEGERLRALVAEDNQVNQEVIIAMLEGAGLSVDLAPNGRDAVEAFSKRPYHVVFMDCQMPEMDGFKATRLIRRMESERGVVPSHQTPVIAVTAHALVADQQACLQAGMNDFLSKPFSEAGLREILERWLPLGDENGAAPEGDTVAPPHHSSAQSPAAPNESPHALDTSRLSEIRAISKGNGDELVRKVIERYLETAPRIVDELFAAAEQDDSEGLFRGAHTLKSSSANVGAMGLSRLAAALESKGRDGTSEGVDELLASLREELARVVAALEAEIAPTPA